MTPAPGRRTERAPATRLRRLEGAVAIVTGAGSGIGRAVAVRFAEEGAAVVVADASEQRGAATVEEIVREGGRARSHPVDVSRADDVERLVADTLQRHGRLHVMVNNAGVRDGYVSCLDMSEALFDRIMAINLKGVFLGCKSALAPMVAAGYGKIINVASIAGMRAKFGGPAYVASKHAVLGLTRQLALEYAPHGVRINALCPGAIASNLAQTSPEVLGPLAPPMGKRRAAASGERSRAATPLGTGGQPLDVASAAAFLASSEGDFITGHGLVVDGGRVLT
jgi:NAD(P)-dependent dehydrogenase (short-subunit alcohol dehydrogenase family)